MRPRSGDRPVRHERVAPEAPQARREGLRLIRPLGEEHERRPRARDERGESALRAALTERVVQIGGEQARGRLQVVADHRRKRFGAARPQRLQHRRVGGGRPTPRADVDRRPQPVELGVDGGGREPLAARHEHPVEAAARQRGRELVAAAGADGGAAEDREGHVRAEQRAEALQLEGREMTVEQLVDGHEGGGGIRRAPAHAARDRHSLVDLETDACGVAEAIGDEARRAHREVRGIRRHPRHVDVSGHDDLIGVRE